MNLAEIVAQFAGRRVLVIGDAMLDIYTCGATNRRCPEGPALVVDVTDEQLHAGGGANTAMNLAHLGANVTFLSVTGRDNESDQLLGLMSAQGIDTSPVLQSPLRRTLVKNRLMAESQLMLRLDDGTKTAVEETAEEHLLAAIDSLDGQCDAIVVSDYGYGVLTPRVIERLGRLRSGAVLAVDAKELTRYRAARPDLVKPNCAETLRLLRLPHSATCAERMDEIAARGAQLCELTGARIVAVTFDRDGCLCFQANQEPLRVAAPPCRTPRVAGAGDTFLSAFTLALAAGAETAAAAQLANLAAAVVVEKEQTATCSGIELMDRVTGTSKPHYDLARLARRLAERRQAGERIVLTNGCFDILHNGHVAYLEQARALGDVLVVGVNSDEGIRRLKGPTRPINVLDDRLGVLKGLGCVDYLIAFDEDTPHRLIEAIQPHTFVKGGDYTRETLPEAELVERLGGEIRILPLVPDRSTTNIINKIHHNDDPSHPRSEDASPFVE